MRLLICEDDAATAAFLFRRLRDLGHDVTIASTGPAALDAAMRGGDDAVVLDRMLPGIDGLSVLRHIRAAGVNSPVLLLTALDRIQDRVDGLDAGADDYLVKPFALAELCSRLDAITRRRNAGESRISIAMGGLVMDLIHRQVSYNGRNIPLQPREFRLLEEMVRNAGTVVTRTMLLESVWGFHFDPQTKLVETHMSRLRQKMALGGMTDTIETVRKVGYRLPSPHLQ